jgi:hypothetical protein
MGNLTQAIEDFRAALSKDDDDDYSQRIRGELLCEALFDAAQYTEVLEGEDIII